MSSTEPSVLIHKVVFDDKPPPLNVVVCMERKFIKLYQQMPQLWKTSHPDYTNKYARNAAYDALLAIYKQTVPNATRANVRQKINTLRSCYRKDTRKYLNSRTITPEGDVVYTYKPGSWKFEALRFLQTCQDKDAKQGKPDATIDENTENEDDGMIEYEETETEYIMDESTSTSEPNTTMPISPVYIQAENPLTQRISWGNGSTTQNEDVLDREFNAIGANVACKLQRMNPRQRYHAELLINKVLISGLQDQLKEETDLTEVWRIEEIVKEEYVNQATYEETIPESHDQKQEDSPLILQQILQNGTRQ